MKKFVLALSLSAALLFSSCLGSYRAFNNLLDWNSGVSDSRFVNNLVFWGLWIVPVYELFILGDTFIFNVIEFWSGSNPIALEEGESEVQLVERDGNLYRMRATKNRLQVAVIEGPKKGSKIEFFYRPDEKSWNAIRPSGEIIPLSRMEEGFYIVYMPDGKEVRIQEGTSREEGVALLREYRDCYAMDGMLAEGK